MTPGAPGQDSLPMLLLLCLAAGHVDATGYLQQKVFAANMTGNTVLAAMSLAHGDWAGAFERASTLLAFFAGAASSALLTGRQGRTARLPLWIEAALLALACALDPRRPEWLWLITAAMGIQASVLVRHRQTVVSTVVVTNTIARIAQLLSSPAGAAAVASRPEAGLLGLCWAAYAVGALVGALVSPLGVAALAPGVGLVLVAALLPHR